MEEKWKQFQKFVKSEGCLRSFVKPRLDSDLVIRKKIKKIWKTVGKCFSESNLVLKLWEVVIWHANWPKKGLPDGRSKLLLSEKLFLNYCFKVFAVLKCEELGYAFLYTFPTSAAKTFLQRAGFRKFVRVRSKSGLYVFLRYLFVFYF